MLQKGKILSFEQYLATERAALNRHEYFKGGIYEREGESLNHGRIKVNVSCLLAKQLKKNIGEVFVSGLRVCDTKFSFCFYPDVSVIASELEVYNATEGIVHNPKVVIEVLSPITEAFDRGEKFTNYCKCSSLTAYILISQERVCIEYFTRQPNDIWLFTSQTDLARTIYIESIDCHLPLKEVYTRVEFPVKEESPESQA